MRKLRPVPFIISALLIAAALAVLPALQGAKAALAIYIESRDPEEGASGVLADSGRHFTVDFNTVIALTPGYTPYIYWYDGNPSHTWADSCAPCTDAVQSGPDGDILSFGLPACFSDGLPTDTTFGMMLPGPDNVYGDNSGYNPSLDNPGSIFCGADSYSGIDFPFAYTSIDGGFAGCWTFKTARSYDAPSVQSMLPASGSAGADPDAEIHLYFDQPVSRSTGDYYIDIMDYNSENLVVQIPTAELVIAGGTSSDVVIPAQALAYSTRYYITIFTDAFTGDWSGLPGGGVYDKSLNFTTKASYTLTYTPGENGHLESGGFSYYSLFQQQVGAGEDGAAVTAAADDHCHLVQWSDGNTNATRTDTNVSEDINVTAHFAIDAFTLDYGTDGNGTLSAGGSTGLSTYHENVDYGGSGAEITAVPNTGCHFVRWSDGVLTASRTETNVQENINVTAEFAIDTYTLNYTAGANGTLTVGSSTGLSDYQQSVNYMGSGPSVTAVPAAGYQFVRWSDGSTDAARTDTDVTGNISVTAEFAHETRTLTYIAGEHGLIDGVTPQTVAYGGSGTQVTATPALGYHFVSWSDGVLTASRTDTDVTVDISVTAAFEISAYALRYSAGAHGNLTGDINQSVEYGGSGTQVTATPDAHYHFVKWSDDVITSSRTDKNVVRNIDVIAEFALDKYKVTFEDYDGTALKTQYVAYGSDAAPPEDPEREGYTFTGWDGDYHDITAAATVTAEYDINTYKVAFIDYDGTELKTQNVIYGTSAAPPADPVREGYAFTGWDGDYTKIKGAVTLTAQYKANTFKVTFVDYDGRVIEAQDVEYGKDALVPADPARIGYVFTGWDKEFTAVKEDITITARYMGALTVKEAGKKDGNPAVVVDAGNLDVTGASVKGGKAIVNPDGTITLEFPDGVKAGDVEVTLTLADGTTVVQTVTITDEAIAAMRPETASDPQMWLWMLIGSLAVIAAALITLFIIKRRRYAR